MLVLSLITVFLGSTLALREDTLKKRLAYSTVSQVSYVVFGLMLLNPTALEGALFQTVFHAIAKNALFMATGAIIYKTHLTQVSQLRGVGTVYPGTMWCFALSALVPGGAFRPPAGSGPSGCWPRGRWRRGWRLSWWGCRAVLSALLTAGICSPLSRTLFPGP